MRELRSESISRSLLTAMIIILLSFLLVSVPLIIRSYQSFKINQQAQSELESLQILADLANQISRERAPSNNVLSSTPAELEQKIRELTEYRRNVDQHLAITIKTLRDSGFYRVASYLEVEFIPALKQGRDAVDTYATLPESQRSMLLLDQTIQEMFVVWDSVHEALQMVVNQSQGKETAVAHYYTLILLLAEFRDQAGRAGSNIMAPLAFDEDISENNMARFLQTKRQSHYLWELVDVLMPEHNKTAKFVDLHMQVQGKFLNQALPMIDNLVASSELQGGYAMTAEELTEALRDKFITVVDLQSYILDYSIVEAREDTNQAKKHLMLTIMMTLIAIVTAAFTMFYLRRYVFLPLIRARRLLFELSETHGEQPSAKNEDSTSLFSAIQHLQEMLRQREHMEFKLKNLANTDSLTGVANRFALDAFINVLDSQPTKFSQTCLIVVDIDYFKQVNDSHGHIVGDQVIQWVADTLKNNVRTTDLLVRYGGDEFLLIIEHIELPQAVRIADKIREEIGMARILATDDQPIPVSVSIGVAVGANSWLSLLEKADQALFRAKAAGRNTVSS